MTATKRSRTLCKDEALSHQLRHKVVKGNRALYAYYKIIKREFVNCNKQMALYKTLIRSLVSYGREMFTAMLEVVERNVQSKIYEPVKENTITSLNAH